MITIGLTAANTANGEMKLASVIADLSSRISYELGVRRNSPLLRFTKGHIAQKTQEFERKRKFDLAEYEALLAPYMDNGYRAVSHLAYTRIPEITDDDKIVLMRHDVDHDIVGGLKLAEWEQHNGISTTYCLLHTAWYYGEYSKRRYHHSQLLADSAIALQEMGHEVSFHSNLIAHALRTGADPAELLTEELAFFRDLGVEMCGSSAHGDALCRQLEVSNHQIFSDCCKPKNEGRVLTHTTDGGEATSVALGSLTMADFGLTYEAYDIALDIYHYDVGGNMRTKEKPTRFRQPFGRPTRTTGSVVGLLTHPVWWDLRD